MSNKYTLSKRADKQLQAIYKHSAKNFGSQQATNYLTGLEETFQHLGNHPALGRQCDSIRKGYRRHEYQRHIIFYRQRPYDIFIAAIVHEKMDTETAL